MPTRSCSFVLFGQLCGLSLAKPISQMRKLTSIAVEWQPSHTESSYLLMFGSGLSVVMGPRKGCEQVGGGDRRPGDPVKGLHQDLGLGTCGQCSTVPQTQIGVPERWGFW